MAKTRKVLSDLLVGGAERLAGVTLTCPCCEEKVQLSPNGTLVDVLSHMRNKDKKQQIPRRRELLLELSRLLEKDSDGLMNN